MGRRHEQKSRTWAIAGVLAAGLGVLPSCEPSDGGARQSFATLTSCPPDETTIVPRPDYRIPLPPQIPPPPEVAADPARLTEWQRRSATARRVNEETPCGAALPSYDAYEVSGCGQRVMLCCPRPPTYAAEGSCLQQPLAGGSPPVRVGSPALPPTSAPPVAAPAATPTAVDTPL
ncbi:MAG TPA: hypothetical protein VGL81_22335 [Polyangiaceae bacterium]|jgi:hypothetical protein